MNMATRHGKNSVNEAFHDNLPNSGNPGERELMQDLQITSVDKNLIFASDESGNEYQLEVDETSFARLKKNHGAPRQSSVSPREIQRLLRSGLSIAEVSALSGADPEQIDRYAGPVLAEREYVVTTAQALPAFGHIDTTTDSSAFGDILSERLDLADARERSWTAWRDDENRWILKVAFVVAGIERDARWIFDHKRQSLTPLNDEAGRFSSPGTFTPTSPTHLRAVPDPLTAAEFLTEQSFVELGSDGDVTSLLVEGEAVVTNIDSGDLLEALRKRRNSSEQAPAWLRDDVASRTAPLDEIVEDSLDFNIRNEEHETDSQQVFPLSNTGGHKRSRPVMPSWNDIVSETKSGDDLI